VKWKESKEKAIEKERREIRVRIYKYRKRK
jgi:hypothetical protein